MNKAPQKVCAVHVSSILGKRKNKKKKTQTPPMKSGKNAEFGFCNYYSTVVFSLTHQMAKEKEGGLEWRSWQHSNLFCSISSPS